MKTHWKRDRTKSAEHLIRRGLVRLSAQVKARAEACPDQKTAEKMYKTAHALQSRGALTRVLPELQAHPSLTMTIDEFNSNPYILTTPAGTVELRTGKIRTPAPEDLCSMCTGVAPEPGEPTQWLKLLTEACSGDMELVNYLQRVCGYALTGLNVEKLMWVFHGPHDTSKSQVLRVLELVFGDYHVTIPSGTLLGSRGSRHPTDLASIAPARLATGSEVPERASHWDAQTLKQITGGDSLQVRAMRQDFYEVRPLCRIMLFSNSVPSTAGGDKAMIRRLELVPFTHKVAKKDQVPNLGEKIFEAEGGKILSWLIEGARQYLADGLGETPAIVRKASEEYAESEDLLAQFIAEVCVLDAEAEDTSANLFQAWRGWCAANGYKDEIGSQSLCTRALKTEAGRFGLTYSTNVNSSDDGSRGRGFKGIRRRLTTEFEAEDDPKVTPMRKAASK